MSCKNAKWVDWKSSNQICGDIQMVLSCRCKSSNQISDDIKKMLSVSPIINQSDLRLHLDDVVCVIFCQKQLMRSITRSTTFHQNQNNSRNDCNQYNSSQSWANDQSRLCQKKKPQTEIIFNKGSKNDLIFLPIVENPHFQKVMFLGGKI